MCTVLPEYRGRGIAPLLWSADEVSKWAKKNKAFFGFIGTYGSFKVQLLKSNPEKYSSVGYVSYESLKFNPKDANEKSVFDGIESGMNLMALKRDTSF